MNKIVRRISRRKLAIFLGGMLIAGVAAALWLRIGEPWETVADGAHYLLLFDGKPAPLPFGYRLLMPWLARQLPGSASLNFGILSLSFLIVAGGVVALYADTVGQSTFLALSAAFLWATSFAFAYYGTTWVRADPAMYCLLFLGYLLSAWGAPVWSIFLVGLAGQLAHETMMILLAALWIDKLTGGGMTNPHRRSYRQLLLLSLWMLVAYLVVRAVVPVLPNPGLSYMSASPWEMAAFTIANSGGALRHLARIYSAFGPILLYALAFLCLSRNRADTWAFLGLFALTVLASLLATDTLRVMSLVILPVMLYASRLLLELYRSAKWRLVGALLASQVAYSFLVYGHLRSFKHSPELNQMAIAVSVVALGLAVHAARLLRNRPATPLLAATAEPTAAE